MRVTYFFRTPTANFHSIENLFSTIITNLPSAKATRIYLPYKSALSPLKLLRNCLYAFARQADVNHITGEVNYLALILSTKRTILTIHDIESLKSKSRIKSKLLHLMWLYLPVKRVKFITVVSNFTKEQLITATGISEKKVAVIPNVVSFNDKDFLPKGTIDKACPVLLQIGTKSNKNLDNLVKAIKGFSCKLMIVGALSVDQISLLLEAGIKYENYISISNREVTDLYYKADIITFVSLYEGFGLPILEANALGRPVITSTTASMPEVAGEGAFLVNPYKPDDIREAILKLTNDDEFRNKLVQVGYRNVHRFKPEVIAAQYEALYRRVIEEDS